MLALLAVACCLSTTMALSSSAQSSSSHFSIPTALTQFSIPTALTDFSIPTFPTQSSSDFVDSTMTGCHILQLITPTTQVSEVPLTAILTFSNDAASFYQSYTDVDKFELEGQLGLALNSLPPAAQITLDAYEGRLLEIALDAEYSLLEDPIPYLSRLHDSASLWPSHFSSSLLSQATGILRGYESLATKDVLGKKPTQGPITPGMSIDVGPKATGAVPTAKATNGGKTTSAAAAGNTVTSKAAALPVATANAQLLVSAAAAAAGVIGAVLL